MNIDLTKRYDLYCQETSQQTVVYRNARLKGIKSLFQMHQYDSGSLFMELEQANGQTIFVARSSIMKFCEHSVEPKTESVANKKPEQ